MKRPLESPEAGAAPLAVRLAPQSHPIDKRTPPRIMERDTRDEVLRPLQGWNVGLPPELVWKTLLVVVRQRSDQHARLKDFMALARVCKALGAACQRARFHPDFLDFRRQGWVWDDDLLKRMYPQFAARQALLNSRWGQRAAPDAAKKNASKAGSQRFRMSRLTQLPAFSRLDPGAVKALYLDDTQQDLLTPLLEHIGDTGLSALDTLGIGRQPNLRAEQLLIDKCPSLTYLIMHSLPAALPAGLECLQLDFFNSKGLDASAYAGKARRLKELYIDKLEGDSASLLQLLAPRLRTLHISDLTPLLDKTLAALAAAPLQDLELPVVRTPGPDYLILQSIPEHFPKLSRLSVQLWLTDAQQFPKHLSKTLISLACMPELRTFRLRLTGVAPTGTTREAIRESLLHALQVNPNLLSVTVKLPDNSELTDPAWTQRALENHCYAPRSDQPADIERGQGL